MSLPVAVSVPGDTIFGRKPFVEITPDGGAAFTIVCKKITGGPKKTHSTRKGISADGKVTLPDRIVPKGREDAFKCEVDEYPAALNTLLTGNTGKCTARVFVIDPDDAANTARLAVVKSGATTAFAAYAEGDGDYINAEAEGDESKHSFNIFAAEAVEYKKAQLF
jgi:hypothetical protein